MDLSNVAQECAMAIEPLQDDVFATALVIEEFLRAVACGCGDVSHHHNEPRDDYADDHAEQG